MSKYTKHMPRIMESVLNCPEGIRMCVCLSSIYYVVEAYAGRNMTYKVKELWVFTLSKILL